MFIDTNNFHNPLLVLYLGFCLAFFHFFFFDFIQNPRELMFKYIKRFKFKYNSIVYWYCLWVGKKRDFSSFVCFAERLIHELSIECLFLVRGWSNVDNLKINKYIFQMLFNTLVLSFKNKSFSFISLIILLITFSKKTVF